VVGIELIPRGYEISLGIATALVMVDREQTGRDVCPKGDHKHIYRELTVRAFVRARTVVAVGLTMKPVGKPDAGNPHIRFDERERETERSTVSPRPSSILQIKGKEPCILVDTLGCCSRRFVR
jgi:hypothetical protein